MATYDLFHKRQRRLNGDVPDVYSYDKLPKKLKVQLVQVWDEALGTSEQLNSNVGLMNAYKGLVQILRKEFGQFQLPGASRYGDHRSEIVDTFLSDLPIDEALSIVELLTRGINRLTRNYNYLHRVKADQIATEAIEEINERFREHGVGFQYVEEEIIRVDSELLHAETVKPALVLLRGPGYQGAQDEFLKAHEHYRHGDAKGALTEALKSIESVMQSICQKRGWPVDPKATSKGLLEVLFSNGLIPSYWQSHFGGLRANLEGGVPTARNKEGGHGQGVDVTTVPQHLAAYILHQTAATIVFLVEAERAFE
jgi:hypothetical protein